MQLLSLIYHPFRQYSVSDAEIPVPERADLFIENALVRKGKFLAWIIVEVIVLCPMYILVVILTKIIAVGRKMPVVTRHVIRDEIYYDFQTCLVCPVHKSVELGHPVFRNIRKVRIYIIIV